MDRNKPSSSSQRAPKKVTSHSGSEFFALGSKGYRDDSKAKIVPISKTSSGSSVDRKREPSGAATSMMAAKKAKLSTTARVTGESNNVAPSSELWEQMATDCESLDIVETVTAAAEQHDMETLVRVICGCIKNLISSYAKSKPDTVAMLGILYLAKLHPDYFANDIITSGLLHILRRDFNVKIRQTSYSHVLACNLLARAYSDKQQWPEIFMRIYIEDAISDRFWSDNSLCAPFIENIAAAFKTRTPQLNYLQPEGSGTSGAGTPTTTTPTQSAQQPAVPINIDDDSCDNSEASGSAKPCDFKQGCETYCEVKDRYQDSERIVEKYVTDAIKEQLNKRQQQECYTRNFLKFLCKTSGLVEVRHMCISRLELWIHNGKLVKFAQELLSYVCFNVRAKYLKDHEVLAILVKMRLKAKPLINFYMTCIKEMIRLEPGILNVILKLVVQNELSNTRNPNNMGMLATMFQAAPDDSAKFLAEIYKEFLLQRDDCLRTLRVFLRELVRMLRNDINLVVFCKVFLNGRPELNKQIESSEFRDRIFHSMVDIICLSMLLSVSPQVREASISLRITKDNTASNAVLLKFYNQMCQIQLDCVSWMYEIVPALFKLQAVEFFQGLHKILLLENAEQYSRYDQWPSEPERTTLLRLVSETPIHEDTLLRIILIGITKEIPFTIPDTFDIIISLIKRASIMRITNCPVVQANKFDIIDFLFSMAEYHHPENINLPVDYEPPKLAITVLYWKAWLIMLMISAHNPSTFGAFCWNHYPTMKMLMEMCITNQFNETAMSKEELQIVPLERDHIVEFESYLAAQTSQAVITEENAILTSQLMLMDPMGVARRVPSGVLEQLRTLNKSFKIGHLLCRSRKPDLLLDIIQRQGTTQSMPWLSDLVQNSDGDFNHLPVQCLCEFLLFNANIINEENSRDAELVNFLRNVIMDPTYSKQTVCEILDYIFRRLCSTVKLTRLSALRGLKIIFKCSDLNPNEWLLSAIPQIPHFNDVRIFIIPQLRSACQVENSPDLVMAYIQFIAANTLDDSVTDMLDHVIDMAQLIVERSTMFQHIIPLPEGTVASLGSDEMNKLDEENRLQTLKCLFVMFNNYIIKLGDHHETYQWTEYPDLLMVQFNDGIQLPLHLNIIHAFIILLTHSSNQMPESIPILDYWFPLGGNVPIAYIPNMPHEPVQLLPDWLKLKMIRSSVDRLIEAAIRELTPDQIVLFVQNFGTPINSMSKLLALLDHAVIEQFDTVKNAILNKAYLAQLIEIQQVRGAKNGHFTVQALGLYSHSQTVADNPKIKNDILECIQLDELIPAPNNSTPTVSTKSTPTAALSSKEAEEIIYKVLKCPQSNQFNEQDFRILLHQLLNNNATQLHHCFLKSINQNTMENLLINVLEPKQIVSLTRSIIKINPQAITENSKFFKYSLNNKRQDATNTSLFATCLKNLATSSQQDISKPRFKHKPSQLTLQQMLMQFRNRMKSSTVNTHTLYSDGMLVDLLSDNDPELCCVYNKQDLPFLFSKSSGDFRFYLLSWICHETNWDTIISTLEYLLQCQEQDFDYSAVLNFVQALINNPKLWQGRDRCVLKADALENIFSLNDKELKMFTEFILREGESELKNSSSQNAFLLCCRINLLFRVCKKNTSNLIKIIENVFNCDCSQKLRVKVLRQMYLMYPSIKFIRSQQLESYTDKLQNLNGCQADKVSNNLITCLGNLFTKKDFETFSSDTELLIRKMAASHPALFLRQMGVLSSLIQGRGQLSLRVIRDEYHMHRFIQILRTLELLQPLCFDDIYKEEFQSALECYFTFFKQYSNVKESYHILIKLIELLQAYINSNPSSALVFIEQYVDVLMDLANRYSSLQSLHQLVQGITLLQQKSSSSSLNNMDVKQDFDFEDTSSQDNRNNQVNTPMETDSSDSLSNYQLSNLDINSRGAVTFAISGSLNKSSSISPHFANLIKIVKHSSAEDTILGPLQEIESITSKRFNFLSELFDRLLELIFSPSAQIRSNAFILLIRHLKHNPGRTDVNRCALNAYIQCLRDDNPSVAATAIDNLSEMTLLLQEHAIEILAVSFSLGIKSRLNTNSQIKRVLQTIMLQHGY
ncbi:integrator complex subunit 1 [Cochliomyia hominivorax]